MFDICESHNHLPSSCWGFWDILSHIHERHWILAWCRGFWKWWNPILDQFPSFCKPFFRKSSKKFGTYCLPAQVVPVCTKLPFCQIHCTNQQKPFEIFIVGDPLSICNEKYYCIGQSGSLRKLASGFRLSTAWHSRCIAQKKMSLGSTSRRVCPCVYVKYIQILLLHSRAMKIHRPMFIKQNSSWLKAPSFLGPNQRYTEISTFLSTNRGRSHAGNCGKTSVGVASVAPNLVQGAETKWGTWIVQHAVANVCRLQEKWQVYTQFDQMKKRELWDILKYFKRKSISTTQTFTCNLLSFHLCKYLAPQNPPLPAALGSSAGPLHERPPKCWWSPPESGDGVLKCQWNCLIGWPSIFDNISVLVIWCSLEPFPRVLSDFLYVFSQIYKLHFISQNSISSINLPAMVRKQPHRQKSGFPYRIHISVNTFRPEPGRSIEIWTNKMPIASKSPEKMCRPQNTQCMSRIPGAGLHVEIWPLCLQQWFCPSHYFWFAI